jgi:hypothetical protein
MRKLRAPTVKMVRPHVLLRRMEQSNKGLIHKNDDADESQ